MSGAAKPERSNSRIVKAKNRIAGQYIVVLKDEVDEWDSEGKATEITGTFGAEIRVYFKDVFKGFSVNIAVLSAFCRAGESPAGSYQFFILHLSACSG
jgi:hypothetical protein